VTDPATGPRLGQLGGDQAVEKAGLPSLNEGHLVEDLVEYEEVSNRGKTSTENLKVQR
jgi:hypothetical protein